MFAKYLKIFIISMLPLIELRGAIPVATAMGLMPSDDISTLLTTYAIIIFANMIPVPFIFLFARRFLEWGKDKKLIGGMCNFFLTKGKRGGEKLTQKAGRSVYIALLLFVGIPLPGTGAWTGTLAASFLDMKFKDTIIAVLCGVLLAGIIMLAISLGAFTTILSFTK